MKAKIAAVKHLLGIAKGMEQDDAKDWKKKKSMPMPPAADTE